IAGDVVEAGTILWAAGVQASPLGAALGAPLDRAGRVKGNEDLTIPNHAEGYVVGDLPAVTTREGRLLPGGAQVAMQQATHAARNVGRMIAGQPREPFTYFNYGDMATIGRNSAVGAMPGFGVKGYFAWLLWLFVHIVKLIGFRSRLTVMTQWA